jgi:hypothetical protein
MKKVFYEKVGRKYIPIREFDHEFLSSLTMGSHLIICNPGGTSYKFNINPEYAPMIAAGEKALDKISQELVNASQLRLQEGQRRQPLTESQHAAWENLIKEFGEDARQLEWPSARQIAEAGLEVMRKEAEKLLGNPAVRKSYDHFLLVCELTKNTEVKDD